MWEAAWCYRCLHDHQFRLGHGSGCPILANALLGEYVDEWIYNEEHVTDPVRRVTCIEFRPGLPFDQPSKVFA
jgi:hypothetical protein